MFHLIGFIIFGFIVGVIARFLTPGKQHMTLLKTTLLGIVGALLAGWFGRAVGWYGPDDSAGFIFSTVGAVVVLLAYHFIAQKRGGSGGISGTGRDDQQFPRKVA